MDDVEDVDPGAAVAEEVEVVELVVLAIAVTGGRTAGVADTGVVVVVVAISWRADALHQLAEKKEKEFANSFARRSPRRFLARVQLHSNRTAI